jgi:hypothetical protein
MFFPVFLSPPQRYFKPPRTFKFEIYRMSLDIITTCSPVEALQLLIFEHYLLSCILSILFENNISEVGLSFRPQVGPSFFFFLVSLGGVRLSPFGTSAVNCLILPAPDDEECGAVDGIRIGKGNRSTRRKPVLAHHTFYIM